MLCRLRERVGLFIIRPLLGPAPSPRIVQASLFRPCACGFCSIRSAGKAAGVAQLVEQRTCNAKVEGSIPFTGTRFIKHLGQSARVGLFAGVTPGLRLALKSSFGRRLDRIKTARVRVHAGGRGWLPFSGAPTWRPWHPDVKNRERDRCRSFFPTDLVRTNETPDAGLTADHR